MPIDIDSVVGAGLPSLDYTWTQDDVILYALGVGAGNPPTDENELRYTYENNLVVLPSYVTIPAFGMIMGMISVDGMDITLDQILHGEQEIEIHGSVPTSGSVKQTGRITNVFDKGKGALVVIETDSVDAVSGELLFTNRASIFVRREGNFGGDSGPPAPFEEPDREPDHIVRTPTLPQQALLYRLSSGDKNPLHADPGFAAFAGFDRPILHGLCSYGIAVKAAIDSALDGPEEVASFRARFSGVVYPGETVVTKVWDEGSHLVVSADTAERGESVISNAGVVRR
jgi:acyl dehydratase